MSKNAEGWIRHRGGKCPVGVFTIVDVMLRCKHEESGIEALDAQWGHCNHPDDVMRYRLHKPAEQVDACSKPEPQDSAKRNSDYVCWMRDRITEIDATTQALATERADLVQKLASEGFALIWRVVEPVEDMSDWRNWKVGDFVTIEGNSSGHKFKTGGITRIKSLSDEDGCGFSIEHIDSSDFWYVDYPDLSWHSRPST